MSALPGAMPGTPDSESEEAAMRAAMRAADPEYAAAAAEDERAAAELAAFREKNGRELRISGRLEQRGDDELDEEQEEVRPEEEAGLQLQLARSPGAVLPSPATKARRQKPLSLGRSRAASAKPLQSTFERLPQPKQPSKPSPPEGAPPSGAGNRKESSRYKKLPLSPRGRGFPAQLADRGGSGGGEAALRLTQQQAVYAGLNLPPDVLDAGLALYAKEAAETELERSTGVENIENSGFMGESPAVGILETELAQRNRAAIAQERHLLETQQALSETDKCDCEIPSRCDSSLAH